MESLPIAEWHKVTSWETWARENKGSSVGFLFSVFFLFFLFPSETGFLCVTVLAILKLALYTRLASNTEIHLPLPPRVLGLKVCATINHQVGTNGIPKTQ